MDRRRHPRYPVNLEVSVIDLSRRGACTQATLTDISAGGVRISLASPLNPGDVIRLDIIDSLFWGHVVHVSAEAGGFSAGIEVERVLTGGSDLSKLLQELLQSAARIAPRVLASG